MRNYLKNIEIVGAVMVYQEGEQCKMLLDWYYENCDRVCILLDNWDKETENIILEYKEKFPDRTYISYSDEPVRESKNKIQGQIKKRFKSRQNYIRERVIIELKKMHDKKFIDLLIWLDSDEVPINQFPEFLIDFWDNPLYDFMALGFVEVYDNFKILVNQKMAPHGRVYKYKPEITAQPYAIRTVYHPYELKRPWKIRHVIVHRCHLTEEYRARRQFFDNIDMKRHFPRCVWLLPKDVREMTVDEIAEYQPGAHRASSKYPSIPLEEYLKNNY